RVMRRWTRLRTTKPRIRISPIVIKVATSEAQGELSIQSARTEQRSVSCLQPSTIFELTSSTSGMIDEVGSGDGGDSRNTEGSSPEAVRPGAWAGFDPESPADRTGRRHITPGKTGSSGPGPRREVPDAPMTCGSDGSRTRKRVPFRFRGGDPERPPESRRA